MKRIFLLAITLIAVFGFFYAGSVSKDGYYDVKRVVDGDTFYVKDGSSKGQSVRLIGINTPETKHPRKPVEFYGKEASAYLTSLLEGKSVRLEFDVDKYDRYNRLLAYVYLEDNTFVNDELVRNGYANVSTYPPNVKYVDVFKKSERKAREDNKGLWNEVAESNWVK